jgi:hypothetical protein
MTISKQLLKVTIGLFLITLLPHVGFAQSRVKIMDLYVHPYLPINIDSTSQQSPFDREVGFKINSPLEAIQLLFQFTATDSSSNMVIETATIVQEGADFYVKHAQWGKQKIYKYNVDLVILMGANIQKPGLLTVKIKDKSNQFSNILTTKFR